MSKLSAYIIAYNEANKIKSAINSVCWADKIVVVDFIVKMGRQKLRNRWGLRLFKFHSMGLATCVTRPLLHVVMSGYSVWIQMNVVPQMFVMKLSVPSNLVIPWMLITFHGGTFLWASG